MVSKRSLYLNAAAIFGLLIIVVVLNSTVLHHVIPDLWYRFTGNTILKDDLDQPALAESAAILALEQENASLRSQLGVATRKVDEYAMARIISIQRNALVSTVIIDRGTEDGLKLDQVVLGSNNVLAGKIGEVFPHTSRVILTDDPRLVISTKIDKSLLAESRGNRHDTVEIGLIAHTEKLEQGQLVSTSGLDIFPPGLAVGIVRDIEPGSNSLFQEIVATTLFNFHESPYLFILF